MYCKNCGKEASGNEEVCTNCGFKYDYGDKFCHNCGKSILPGQSMCVNCGFMLNRDIVANEKESSKNDYQKYITRVKKTKILSIILHIFSLALVLGLLFLPIYQYEYVPETMEEMMEVWDDVENIEDLEKLLESGGKLERNFSLFDDIKIITETLFAEDVEPLERFMFVATCIFPISTVIITIVAVYFAISQITKIVGEMNDIDKSTMLCFNEIKKSGSINKIEKIYKKQYAETMLALSISDLLYSKVYKAMYDSIPENLGAKVRYINSFSNFSGFIFIILLILAGYIVVKIIKKNEEKKIVEDITKEEYEKI